MQASAWVQHSEFTPATDNNGKNLEPVLLGGDTMQPRMLLPWLHTMHESHTAQGINLVCTLQTMPCQEEENLPSSSPFLYSTTWWLGPTVLHHGCREQSMSVMNSGHTAKKKGISLETKLCIADDRRSCVSVKGLMEKYSLCQSSTSTILHSKHEFWATTGAAFTKRKQLCSVALPDLEEAVYKWPLDVPGMNILTSSVVPILKARQLTFLLGHEDTNPESSWVYCSKQKG